MAIRVEIIGQEEARLLLRQNQPQQYDYYETTVQAGGIEPDPNDVPMPPGDGWSLAERLKIGSLLVFRWKRPIRR